MKKQRHLLTFLFLLNLGAIQAQSTNWKSISGTYYDWTKTGKPASPYAFNYGQTLVMHLMLATPDGKGGSYVRRTFKEVAALVKEVDAITLHIPKIIYLVGWQYNGHDDKYPAWHHVNDALKRPEDSTGLQSLIWLSGECKKYNTTISVHVNMADAYKNSPLWDTYWEKGLISRLKDGQPMKTGSYNGFDAYQVCFKEEWEKGYATKRIDELLTLLPFLKEAKTVLLDAYFSRGNPYLNISQPEEESYQRRVIRYFKTKEIDVSQESYIRLRDGQDHFTGLSPWFVWFDQTESGFKRTPASIATGGGPFLFIKQDPKLAGEQMQLGFLFGMSTRGEDCFNDLENDFRTIIDWQQAFKYQFYTGTLPYTYLNKYHRKKLQGKGLQRVAQYSDGLTVSLKDSSIMHKGIVLRKGNDLFIPVVWSKEREIIAYSEKGYSSKTWQLPSNWSDAKTVDLFQIDATGLKFLQHQPTINRHIALSLSGGQAVVIVPTPAQ
ncbi:endo-alpha-N-acetylgalactosaminidase-like protein [Chitinophaga polysaccharea]|uniref:Endo-alpha-N-acetylgalactosaminidase-like protein n=1 Tax=Chitinophaga polysaccharea TaxID=1293035 RepID=A0A561PXH0_9BACT|nr:endo-alpha-N-acetylgalactosaminidase family protein [Chitinophaga polysaccharea]TWF42809.1 endo-alpha-N-acetylgalactosaminidase-like protein [Chitinophaga polysaccharea]